MEQHLLFLKRFIIIFLLAIVVNRAEAQHDSLILKNGNTVVGELKSLDKGVLTIETDYSKNDFTIKWTEIKKIYSRSYFLITLTDGRRINGSFQSADEANKIVIETVDSEKIETTLEQIVYLKGLKSQFWSRFTASIDLGISFAKANNLRQYNVRSNFDYLADKWQLSFYYNDTRSTQDSIADIRRTDWGPSFRYFLQKDWFLNGTLTFLSNTEQAVKLRTTGKTGAGKYLVHTNKAYFGVGGGLSFNNESFTNGTESRNSLEGYVGLEVNLFDLEDFSLLSNLYVYPSFTESGRWRSDFALDAKYDLPYDFYLKASGSVNYDNRPAIAGNEIDYVTAFSIGWEFNK